MRVHSWYKIIINVGKMAEKRIFLLSFFLIFFFRIFLTLSMEVKKVHKKCVFCLKYRIFCLKQVSEIVQIGPRNLSSLILAKKYIKKKSFDLPL